MDAKHRKTKRDVRYAESQLKNLNAKIDKLLNKIDEKEQDEAKTPEEECVICVNSKATMQTWPCGHRVVCRKCLVRTIQMAVSRRSLPLRCVVCRARVLRLKRSSADGGAAASREGSGDPDGTTAAVAAAGRSYSLPAKLRRGGATAAAATVTARSRSVGAGKSGDRRRTSAGWTDPFAGADGDDGRDRNDPDDRHATAIKYSKLDETDRRCNNQSKNGLQRILSKFKFWKFLGFKNNKP